MADQHDLSIERVMKVPRDAVWRALTDVELLRQWWAPEPYQTPECRLDLQPGGVFFTRMTGPDGFDTGSGGAGCVLVVEPQSLFSWTNALGPGFRPSEMMAADCGGFPFTAILTLADAGKGRTLYRATVLHRDQADSDTHAQMGFVEGWGVCAAQLEKVAARVSVQG